jgi:Amt family ammonium transporter
MGIETVAECVENESTCDRLIDMGVDYAQGFHLGRPQPLESLFKG